MTQSAPKRVSVHGGHSGEFCGHAEDSLEDIIRAYIARGYVWIGITEHMPPARSAMILPEEAAAGMDVEANRARFHSYMEEGRRLQTKYAEELTVYLGLETEAWEGYETALENLIETFKPDYIVGSVHHVNDVPIDFSMEHYEAAAQSVGGIDQLYCAYFDLQYDLITRFKPAVVGHIDLIRLLDSDYQARILKPDIWRKIERNLQATRELDLILDFNFRALGKGQTEPYIARPILQRASEMGIAVVPGDDTHSVKDVDEFWSRGLEFLSGCGISTDWRRPI
ncbi:MAG: histidinol-phosphatase [Candidatus Latescibacteria bacterium]|nr:histidinol-phosphatase [Candidatus Latescibacterota bacterium]